MSTAEGGQSGHTVTTRALVIVLAGFALGVQIASIRYETSLHDLPIPITRFLVVKDQGYSDRTRALGLEPADHILAIGDRELETNIEYRSLLKELEIDSPVVLQVERDGEILRLPAVVGHRPLSLAFFVRNLVALAFLVIATFVAWQQPAVRATSLFFLAALTVSMYFTLMAATETGLVHIQALTLGLAPGYTLHFFLSFPRERPAASARWWPLLYVPGIIVIIGLISGFRVALRSGWGPYYAPQYWFWHNVGFTYLGVCAGVGLWSLVSTYKTTRDSILKRQIQWIVWGLACAVLAACGDVVLTALDMQSTTAAGLLLLGAIPLPVAMAFAILRYRLLDVELVVNRSVVYALLTAALAGLYLLLVAVIATALDLAAGSQGHTVVLVGTALVVGLLVTPLRGRIEALIDRIFFKQHLDYERALNRWSEELSTSLSYAELSQLLLVQVPQQLGIERAWLLAINKDKTRLEPLPCDPGPNDGVGPDLTLIAHSPFTLGLAQPTVVLLEPSFKSAGAPDPWPAGSENGQARARHAAPAMEDGEPAEGARDDIPAGWRQAGVCVVLPLVCGGYLPGLYLLGPKRSGDLYQSRELHLLRTLANQAGVALANARLYEQVRAFGQHMEKQVEERTQELRASMTTVCHELRTPLTAIQGVTEIIRSGRAGPVTEQQMRFLGTINTNAQVLTSLVTDLNDVSRIATDGLRVYPEPMDLRAAAEDSVASLAGLVAEKELQMEIQPAPSLPEVYGDYQRVVQILTNLLGNACRYTPIGGAITVAFDSMNGWVQTAIRDTGIGIPPEEQQHIFDQFYRGSDPLVREQRGAGLGLTIAKSLVELQGGRVWVKSETGKGSVFAFTLPAAGGQRAMGND